MGYFHRLPDVSEKLDIVQREFVFVGEHPAIDFADTVVIANGELVPSHGAALTKLSFTRAHV
jgi:hypothetical protein